MSQSFDPAVVEALESAAGHVLPLEDSEWQEIQELEVRHARDLAGIERCTGLTMLSVLGCDPVDIGFVSQFTSLSTLEVNDSGLTSLEGILHGARLLLRKHTVRRLMLAQWLPPAFTAGAEGLIIAYAGGRHFAPGWYAVLMGCLPVGMLVGDLLAGRLLRSPTRERLVVPLIALMGLPLVGFAAEPGVGVSSCLLLICGFGFAYGLGLQRPFLDALPKDGQGQAFGLLGSGGMTLQGVGPVCFGSVAAGIGTGGAIALAGGAATLTAGWILTWHPPTSPVSVPNNPTGSENGAEQHACRLPAP